MMLFVTFCNLLAAIVGFLGWCWWGLTVVGWVYHLTLSDLDMIAMYGIHRDRWPTFPVVRRVYVPGLCTIWIFASWWTGNLHV